MSSFSDRGGGRGAGGRDASRPLSSGGRTGGGGRFEGGGRGRGFVDSGGRGGGGRFGGRGDSGGGAPSGRNRHMGEVGGILGLLRSPGMSDTDILKAIAPIPADRARVITEVTLPSHATWRSSPSVGAKLDSPTHIVQSNFYKIDPSALPRSVYQYGLHVYAYSDATKDFLDKDSCASEDSRVLALLVKKAMATFPQDIIVSASYDGRSLLFSTKELPLSEVTKSNQPCWKQVIALINADGTESSRRYRVELTHTSTVFPNNTDPSIWTRCDDGSLTALESAVLSFARNSVILGNPEWFTYGSKVFRSTSEQLDLRGSPAYMCMRGYYAGLKSCLMGLALVCDMSVSCFMVGGEATDLMWMTGRFRNLNELLQAAGKGLQPSLLDAIKKVFKNAKAKVKHLNRWSKIHSIGPASNSPDSQFECDGKKITVEAYYKMMCAKSPAYRNAMPSGRLKFPELPTLDIGSSKRPVYVPAELIFIPGGQTRSNVCTGEMTAQMIKYSATRPDERVQFLNATESVISVLQRDPISSSFGINTVSSKPIVVSAHILPPARLQYANSVVDAGLAGGWQNEGKKVIRTPPSPVNGGYMYGLLIVGSGPPRHPDWQGCVRQFVAALERDSLAFGVKLVSGGPPITCLNRHEDLSQKFEMFKAHRVRIGFVVLVDDCYGVVKFAADTLGMMTQCLKWKNVERAPRGYHLNVALKVNAKLGGTSHTLASRLPMEKVAKAVRTFQDPPASLSWLFDEPCMLLGMDVSHAEKGSEQESVAAVVASMDGRASQYAGYIAMQSPREEMISALEDSVVAVLKAFKKRNNNVMPSRIIIYRDGVSDGQFQQVIEKELPAVHGALELMGYTETAVKIAVIICQKGHHTRLVYEEKLPTGESQFVNPCPGLCVDANGKSSIASHRYIEFYLNSHVAIQGTSKPCKYTLIYDEIGFKDSELQLLTYWSTYLYCRCNKSVSYATPAYYAHWASLRGRYLLRAGASHEEMRLISEQWLLPENFSHMFFV